MKRSHPHGAPRDRAQWPFAGAALIAASLWAAPAQAQAPGNQVRIETTTGVVEGALVDRVPEGYLVRVGERSQVVPYAIVRSIAVVPEGAPPQPTAPAPVVVMPAGPRVDAVAIVAAPPPAPRSPGLVAGGRLLTVVGAIGVGVGVAVLTLGVTSKSNNTCHAGDVTLKCEYGPGSQMVTGGAVGLSLGGAAAIAGIVMTTVGSPPAPAKVTSAAPRVAVGPGGLALAWTF
jgi:hypothetical protein